MTDYTWPATLYPASSSLTWLDNSARFVSPLSGVTRTVNRPGGRWKLSMSFAPRSAAQSQILEAFLWRLDGTTHRAIICDFSYRRQGTGTGAVVVDGSGQTGRTLLTRGWPAGTLVLKAGDRVSINDQMLVVAEDCYSSGNPADLYLRDEDGNILYTEDSPQQPILIESGGANLVLTHPLRAGHADGDAIEYTYPTARYYLAEQFEVSAMPGVFKTINVEFEEAIDA